MIRFFMNDSQAIALLLNAQIRSVSKGKLWKAKLARQLIRRMFGCHIALNSQWEEVTEQTFPHPVGIVVGEGVKVGRGVVIYQNVTLGQRGGEREWEYPVVEDNVTIYAGAVIAGAITVEKGAIIGANAVVLHHVPAGQVAIGVPAYTVSSTKKAPLQERILKEGIPHSAMNVEVFPRRASAVF
jgi:serine O-acetyltransferase